MRLATDKLEAGVWTYIAHIARGESERAERAVRLLSRRLKIVLDWKMKLTDAEFREAMAKWFGKKGTPFLGVMLLQPVDKKLIETLQNRYGM